MTIEFLYSGIKLILEFMYYMVHIAHLSISTKTMNMKFIHAFQCFHTPYFCEGQTTSHKCDCVVLHDASQRNFFFVVFD